MSSLFLLLPAAPMTATSEFAYVLSVDGRSADTVSRAPVSLLPHAHGAGAESVAVVPADALSWHRVEWPRGITPRSPRLRAVLEGLLEEHLLDEPEALHFAVEPQVRAGEATWIAVCDRPWLRACLQALEAGGHPITRIVPEIAPQSPAALYALGETAQPMWVARSARGVLVVPLAATSMALLPALPDDALCLAEPALAEQAEALLQRPLVLQPAAERWLQAAQSDWNLAQFEFVRSGRIRALRRLVTACAAWWRSPAWRPTRWSLTLLVVVNLIGLQAWAWRERTALEAQRVAIREVLTRTFPQVKSVIDAQPQMAREVAALRQATATPASTDLETQLGTLASAAPDRTAQGLDYTRNTLRVRGLGWTAADLQRAQAALQAQGLAASLEGDALVLRAEGAR
jgi:general secretion pathway protein L